MNILFLTRRFWPDIGGVETHVLKVSERLINEGHQVTVVSEFPEESKNTQTQQKDSVWQSRYMSAKTTGKVIWASKSSKSIHMDNTTSSIAQNGSGRGKKMTGKELPSDIIIYRLPKVKEGRTKKLIIWKWFWENRELFKKADVIHCHDVFFWYLPFKFFVPRKKVYITFHGYEGVYPPTRKAVFIRKISEWLADGNICVGDYIKKWYGTHPDYVTYGGADMDTLKVDPPAKQGGKYPLKILFLGRLEEDTGVPVYLAGLDALKKRGISFEFAACGDGSLRHEVEKYGKVHGFVASPEEYVKNTNIVFASSYLSILQAMAYGKLVAAVYTNPLKEDYLNMAPFSSWIQKLFSAEELVNFVVQYKKDEVKLTTIRLESQSWAVSQTWKNVTSLYTSLWAKK